MKIRMRIPCLAILFLALLVATGVFLPQPAQAATVAFKFNSLGVYPQLATANSQRWFRCNITWDTGLTNAGDDTNPVWMINERIVSVKLDYHATDVVSLKEK